MDRKRTGSMMKISVALLLLLVVAAIVVVVIVKQYRENDVAVEFQGESMGYESEIISDNREVFDLAGVQGRKILIIYFHGTIRCKTCLMIEEYAMEAARYGFAEEIESGRMVLRAVNYDVPGNEHYAVEFDLELPSLVLIDVEDGRVIRWRNLFQTWDLVEDKYSFTEYVHEEIGVFAQSGISGVLK